MREADDLTIMLAGDEALVLYDLLARWIVQEDGAQIKAHTSAANPKFAHTSRRVRLRTSGSKAALAS